MRAVCAWYEVRQTIGAPPLRARMSGAVSRLISCCADILSPRSAERLQCRAAGKFPLRSQFFLDTQKLVVLGDPVGTRQRAGLDLPAIGGDREIGNGGVLGLTGTMRHHSSVAGLV